MEKVESEEQYSKTFVFEKIIHSVEFVIAIDIYFFARSWNDAMVRVTVLGKQIDTVEKIAIEIRGTSKVGKDGEWQNVYK